MAASPPKPKVQPKLLFPGAVWMGQTANVNREPFKSGQPSLIVYHYTASGSGESSARYLHGKHSPSSSAHFVIDRSGTVRQLSDLTRVTWHAGESSWRNKDGKSISKINYYGLGIEVANWGFWREDIKKHVPDPKKAGWLYAKHRNGGPVKYWERYPEPQVAVLETLTEWLLTNHPKIWDLVGHDQIAPSRKVDPGPAFPFSRMKAVLSRVRAPTKPKPQAEPPSQMVGFMSAMPSPTEPQEEVEPEPEDERPGLEGAVHTAAQPDFFTDDLPDPDLQENLRRG
jgi:N-acetyl-anhydromuramyl-L-alanine amidase AmpD